MDLSDRTVVVLGERDGVPAEAIEACLRSAGAATTYSTTTCFV